MYKEDTIETNNYNQAGGYAYAEKAIYAYPPVHKYPENIEVFVDEDDNFYLSKDTVAKLLDASYSENEVEQKLSSLQFGEQATPEEYEQIGIYYKFTRSELDYLEEIYMNNHPNITVVEERTLLWPDQNNVKSSNTNQKNNHIENKRVKSTLNNEPLKNNNNDKTNMYEAKEYSNYNHINKTR